MNRYVLVGPEGSRKHYWRRKHPLLAVEHPVAQPMPAGCTGLALPKVCRVDLGATCEHGFTFREIELREVADA